jgi:hypothetical protein
LRLVHREDNVEEKRHIIIGQNMGVRESIIYGGSVGYYYSIEQHGGTMVWIARKTWRRWYG